MDDTATVTDLANAEEADEDKINEVTLAELPSDMSQLLLDITPNFEENLTRAFRNNVLRLHRKPNTSKYVHPLDDVLWSIGDTKIELHSLKFPWVPDFRIQQLSPDIPMACLDLVLNLGNLQIEGTYEAHNSALRQWLPVSQMGRIMIRFNNVKASGKVGLVIDQDSFVPQNYDIKYEPSDVVVRVGYYHLGESNNEVENEVGSSDIDSTLGKTVWVQLTEILSNLLHRQLAEVVVEFSLVELLVDRDDEFRELTREKETRANALLDSLLCTAKDHLVATDHRSVATPPFAAVFKGGRPSGVNQGTFATKNGYLADLSTLTRPHNFSLYEDKERLSVYGLVSLRDFKHGYRDYEAEYEGTTVKGDIKAAVYHNQIFVKVTVKKEGERCSTSLDEVRVVSVRDVDIDISGLASLSWLNDKVKSWVIGNLRQMTLQVLERHVEEALEHAIANSDCVNFLLIE